MDINNEEPLKHIKSKILEIQVFSAPGTILLSFGLYGMFGANSVRPLFTKAFYNNAKSHPGRLDGPI